MNRSEALEWLRREHHEVQPGQKYSVDYFKPEDAPGLARLFFTVYGDGYPIDTFYIPERLVEENRSGTLRSVVGRTESGDIVAHSALFRSSPPNSRLYEWGLGLTLPAYRISRAFFRISELLMKLVGQADIDGFFGEAVCNHTATQKLSRLNGAVETALEPALMPAEAYAAEKSAAGRVGCLLFSRIQRDGRRPLHIPERYRPNIEFLMEGLALERDVRTSAAPLPEGVLELEVTRFAFAGVARCTVKRPGDDLRQITALEQTMVQDGWALAQIFIDLAAEWSSTLIERLHGRGYRLGGLLPGWFGSDGFLMQKHFVEPGFEQMHILSDRGLKLVEMVRDDMRRENR